MAVVDPIVKLALPERYTRAMSSSAAVLRPSFIAILKLELQQALLARLPVRKLSRHPIFARLKVDVALPSLAACDHLYTDVLAVEISNNGVFLHRTHGNGRSAPQSRPDSSALPNTAHARALHTCLTTVPNGTFIVRSGAARPCMLRPLPWSPRLALYDELSSAHNRKLVLAIH